MVGIARIGVVFVAFLVCSVCAMYGSRSDVVSATDKSFKEDVLKHAGVVIVEFYAPWYVRISWIFHKIFV